MAKKNIKNLFICVCTIGMIVMFIVGLSATNKYNILQKKYNDLLNQPKKTETIHIEEEVKVEIEKEVIKEIPVYTEAEALSEEDFFLLCQLIYREAGSPKTSNLDRTLVGNVALNRVDCNYRKAETLKDVIYTKGQYSTASVLTDNEHIQIPMSSVLAAYRLAIGNRYCPNNVIFQAQWEQGDGVWKKVNNHYYCYTDSIEVNEHQEIKELKE